MKPYEKAGRVIRLLAWFQIVGAVILGVLVRNWDEPSGETPLTLKTEE